MTVNKIRIIGVSVVAGLILLGYVLKQADMVSEGTLQVIAFVLVLSVFISIPIIIQFGQRKTQLLPFITDQLTNLEYSPISERPLNLQEILDNLSITPAPNINGRTIPSIVNRSIFHRIILVQNNVDEEFELYTTIYQKHNGKFTIEVNSKKRV